MSSIASSRRNRPNDARDADSLRIVTDFSRVIADWAQEQGVFGTNIFQLRLEYMIGYGSGAEMDDVVLSLDDSQIVRVTIPRGPTHLYRFTLDSGSIVLYRCVRVPEDAGITEPVDLLACEEASADDVREALAWEAPRETPEPAPAAPAPVLKFIPRAEGDTASYLGFTVGFAEREEQMPHNRWQAVAFHLSSPQVIGRISSSVFAAPNNTLELGLYDALGNLLLRTELSGPEVSFEQLRLNPGDHLILIRGSNLRAFASACQTARVLGEDYEPVRPILNEILWGAGARGGAVVPQFVFTAA